MMHPLSGDDDDHVRRREKARLEEAIKAGRRAVLVVNTRSRRGEQVYAQAKQLLTDNSIILDGAFPVRDPARLPEIVAETITQGHTFVIVGGGDGTISSVVDGFAYKDVVFGLLPLGTANSFARTLSIPLDLAGAVDVLTCGKVVDIDLGKINDDYFANVAALGLPAAIARSMPRGLKKVLGRAAYLIVAGALITRFEPFQCTVTLDRGKTMSFEAVLQILIANGAYNGGVLVAEEASVESRDLMVHIVKGRSRLSLAKIWAQIGAGVRPSADELESLSAHAFSIDTDPRQYVSIDGEAVTQTPIRVGLAREALRIMVPRDRDDLL